MFCVNCGNELPSSNTINYCPNCGQQVKGENKIAKYTSDGKPVNEPKVQESIPTSATTTEPKSELSDTGTPKAKGIAKPLNYDTKYISNPGSSKGKAIGALIVIIIIIVIIAAIAKWLYQSGRINCDNNVWLCITHWKQHRADKHNSDSSIT